VEESRLMAAQMTRDDQRRYSDDLPRNYVTQQQLNHQQLMLSAGPLFHWLVVG
jgi:hypothetical protein